MKTNLFMSLAAITTLSSCSGPSPRGDYIEQINFIGAPVHNVVNDIPPNMIPITVEEW
jgi:hypothetical protein